jgi:hypothetical protein
MDWNGGRMTSTCPNLCELYGDVYRITHDAAAESRIDPWGMVIISRLGEIYPFGGDLLAVDIDRHPAVARKVAAVPGVRVHQDGGLVGEMTYVFHMDQFAAVAAIMKPKRLRGRRQLLPEERARVSAAGMAALARYRQQRKNVNLETEFRAIGRQAG